jgi:hypothetical protein
LCLIGIRFANRGKERTLNGAGSYDSIPYGEMGVAIDRNGEFKCLERIYND